MLRSLPLPLRHPGVLLGLVLAAFSPVGGAAQQETGALVVSVLSRETGEPLEGATVAVAGTRIAAATNAAGVLRLAGVPLGTQTVEVRRLGYAPRLRLVHLRPGRAVAATFSMEVQPIAVAEIRVRGERASAHDYLRESGFERRRAAGLGSFVTRREIEEARPRFLSDVLRRVPGLVFYPNNVRGDAYVAVARNGGAPCPIQYYVDGQIIGHGFNADEVVADDVEGVEIYRGAAQVPAEFNRRAARCGVIVIWTRRQ